MDKIKDFISAAIKASEDASRYVVNLITGISFGFISGIMEFLHDYKNIAGILYIFGSFVSGYFTFEYIKSSESIAISVIITCCIELGKAVCNAYQKTVKSKQVTILWSVLMSISIYCSMGYFVNSVNRVENYLVDSSPEYKQLKDKENRLNSLIQEKTIQLTQAHENEKNSQVTDKEEKESNNGLIYQYNNQIKSLQTQLNSKNYELQEAINKESKGKSMANTKDMVKNEIKYIQSQIDNTVNARDNIKNKDSSNYYQNLITQLNTDVNDLNDELAKIDYKNIKVDSMKADHGMLSMHLIVAKLLHVDNYIYILIFNLILATVFELLINLFYKMSFIINRFNQGKIGFKPEKQSSTEGLIPEKNIVYAGMPQNQWRPDNLHRGYHSFTLTKEVPQQPIRRAGFDPSLVKEKPSSKEKEYDTNDIIKYLEFNYKNATGEQAPGIDKFTSGTDLTYKQIKGIRFHLEQLGIVKVESKRTVNVVPSLSQAIEIIKKKNNP